MLFDILEFLKIKVLYVWSCKVWHWY